MTSKTSIDRVVGRRLWDSRGRPTVEVDIHLAGGGMGRAVAPAGMSTGTGEALDLRDGGRAFGGLDVTKAVAAVNAQVSENLIGMDAADQEAIDAILVALDESPEGPQLGSNATIATSMAVAHATASAHGVPLWKYLANGREVFLPLPEIQIFGGGAHAGRRVDVQDFMVVATGADDFSQALDWTAEVYRAAGELMEEQGLRHGVADEGGFWPEFKSNDEALVMLMRAIERAGFRPGEQVAISLDIASSEFGEGGLYRFGLDKQQLDRQQMVEFLLNWTRAYPIVAIEDPLAEDDADGLASFTRQAGNIAVVGDDFLVTNADRIRKAHLAGACNTVLIKPNQAGTLTRTKAAFDVACELGWASIVSARSGETEDVGIVHLAVGWGAPMLKVGSFARSERMAKWNEGIRIAETLGNGGALSPARNLPWER